MAKFDGRPTARPVPDARTHQGGVGFSRDSKEELFLLGIANAVGEDTFYESGADRDSRFVDLIHKVAGADPEWAAQFIGWLRSGANMRSASIVAAAEYVRSGATGGRQVVASVLLRPDEPGEMLAYWTSTHGRRIPQPVKRGVADAVRRLYTERNLLKYDGSGKSWRWGDVIDLTHPKAQNPGQSDLFRHAIDRRHGRDAEIPEVLYNVRKDRYLQGLPAEQRREALPQAIEAGWNWERLAGWLPGGMDAAAWEAVVPNMGLMALVRNLRNFDDAGLSNEVAEVVKARLRDPEEVRRSRQFPLRFLSAWKNTTSLRWGDALETALSHSLSSVPVLKGKTLVLVDVSWSMHDTAISGQKGRPDGLSPERWEVAGVFGISLARRAENADVCLFGEGVKATMTVAPHESVLRMVEAVKPYVEGGTDTLGSLAAAYNPSYDRVVILTDEQTGPAYHRLYPAGRYHNGARTRWDAVANIRCPVYTFNLAGYEAGHSPIEGNWFTFGGLNDACFGLIDSFEGRSRNRWPWDAEEG